METKTSKPLNPNAEEWSPPAMRGSPATWMKFHRTVNGIFFRPRFHLLPICVAPQNHLGFHKVLPVSPLPPKNCYRKTIYYTGMTKKQKIWVPKKTISFSGDDAGGVCVRSSPPPGKTTLMIRNIPNQYKRNVLLDFLENLCYEENTKAEKLEKNPLRIEFDFVYLPIDFVRRKNLGYAFVNFTSNSAATRVSKLLQDQPWTLLRGYCGGGRSSKKICQIDWARIQGKAQLVRHFQNSYFCCDDVGYLPVVFARPRDGAAATGVEAEPTTVGRCLGVAKAETIGRELKRRG